MRTLEKLQHRAVVLLEEIARDVDLSVRGDTDEVLIVGAVMDRTQAYPVGDDWIATLFTVSHDVSGFE